MTQELTQSELQRLFHYDPETGLFTRLIVETKNKTKVGDIAGTDNGRGYLKISINGKKYFTHRLAILYMTGHFPVEYGDHINGIKKDNRWCNLRNANPQESSRNRSFLGHNTSGFVGASYDKDARKWSAKCRINKKLKHLGMYETAELASQAYQAFAKLAFGEYYRDTITSGVN